jgi:hypothetical protein
MVYYFLLDQPVVIFYINVLNVICSYKKFFSFSGCFSVRNLHIINFMQLMYRELALFTTGTCTGTGAKFVVLFSIAVLYRYNSPVPVFVETYSRFGQILCQRCIMVYYRYAAFFILLPVPVPVLAVPVLRMRHRIRNVGRILTILRFGSQKQRKKFCSITIESAQSVLRSRSRKNLTVFYSCLWIRTDFITDTGPDPSQTTELLKTFFQGCGSVSGSGIFNLI